MKCQDCKTTKKVDRRYSFGVYAGIFCEKCCKKFRDHCGIDQDQGRASDLDEQYWEE